MAEGMTAPAARQAHRWTASDLWRFMRRRGYYSVRLLVETIRDRHKAGDSIRFLASDYGMSRHTITTVVRWRKLPPYRPL